MSNHQAQQAIEDEARIDDLSDEHFSFLASRTDGEIFFAKERYQLHLATPDEGVNLNVLKKYIYSKYGF